ncbi:asparaginase [Sporolactobacillus spathodeae]|uniref:asparaginase n=1 Tax=Sporolactobacillus spathodeae TaxID=1465502 RepID=A0ABS2Q689_9BACL|nr:asparaginase [Sporolactobacillus spathodeae]MBM7657293.1 L-asparaginase [Sporolactobacillus spathodeae]
MKKILVLATGGTIASTAQANGLAPGLSLAQLSGYFNHFNHNMLIDFRVLMNKDSTNMQPEDWLTIATEIRNNQLKYDSFIITHGTDTMGFTAAGLSYLLHDIDKTIVITGSQVPVSFHKTDAKKNIRDALTFAQKAGLPGVFVVFDGVAIIGTRAVKMRTKSYDAFKSINYPYIATIHEDTLTLSQPFQREVPSFLKTSMAICPDVFLMRIFPGLSPMFFDFLKGHTRGVIIESFGNGGLPFEKRDLVTKIRELTAHGVPVIITTQCLEEGQNMDIYEVGKRAAEAGGITAGDMNTEAIVAKLMWILGQTNKLNEIKRLIQTPIAHDLTYI